MRMHLHRGQEHVDDAAVGVQHNGRRFVVVTVRLAGVDTHGKGTYLFSRKSSTGGLENHPISIQGVSLSKRSNL